MATSRSRRWCRISIRGRQTPPDPFDDLCSFTYDERRDAKKIADMQARIARGVVQIPKALDHLVAISSVFAQRKVGNVDRSY
ncbi:hypothetical protein [Nocardia sp. MW-W600-9]